jgi:hypothetical protein
LTSYQPPPPTGQPPLPPPYGTPARQPYGAPAPQPYGAPAGQPYGAPAPPPATPDTRQAVNAPAVAWLVPAAALLGLIGAFTPWFKAKATLSARGQSLHHTFDPLYSFKDGKIGLLGPILLVVLAVGVVGMLLGRAPSRFGSGSANPVASAGKATIIVGAISLVCTVIAWFLVTTQYRFKDEGKTYSWNEYIKLAKSVGAKLELQRGPQLGYFLTIVAGILAIIAGVLMVLAARGDSSATRPSGYQGPAGPQGPPGPPQMPPPPPQ